MDPPRPSQDAERPDLGDNQLNRTAVAWATFYPVQVYLALLYVQIEDARKIRSKSQFFEDDELFAYFDMPANVLYRFTV